MTTPAIPKSTVPAARKYIFDAVTAMVAEAAYEDPPVAVYLGDFGDPDFDGDIVVIGSKVARKLGGMRVVGGGGPHWLKEEYSISVRIQCASLNAADFTGCDARAFELLAIVETAVRVDPSLGGLVIMSQPGTSETDSLFDDGEGHTGAQTFCESFITVVAEQ